MSHHYLSRLVLVGLVGAVAVASVGVASPTSARSNPNTCAYQDARLVQACRTDPEIRSYLRDPDNAGVETYMDLPPVVRGWEPGEEEALLGLLSPQPQPYQQVAQAAPSPGSPAEVMERLRRIASGEYAAQVEADRARTPPVNWSPAQIRAAARRAVTSKLREPSSAQFRSVRRIQHDNGTTMFCGELSGRNAYGGVSDFKRFEAGVTIRGEASAQVDDQTGMAGSYFNTAWNQFCGRIAGTPIQF